MQVAISQEFAVSPAEVAAAYVDPELYARFEALPKLADVRLVGVERRDDVTVVRVHERFAAPLNAMTRKVLDPARLGWVEESELAADGSGTFRILPDHYERMLRFAGRITLGPGRGEGTAHRRITGELAVSLPLPLRPFAGVTERTIVDGLADVLAAQVPLVEAHVAERRS